METLNVTVDRVCFWDRLLSDSVLKMKVSMSFTNKQDTNLKSSRDKC